MEVGLYCPEENSIWVRSVLEAMVVETVLTVGKSLTSLLFTVVTLFIPINNVCKFDSGFGDMAFECLLETCSLLNEANVSLRLSAVEER
ncbi:hypothetical protein F8388_004436 [Cannabis sativa]|uniref:Uncharacterized protein n=1 Tax=Cannabis sativa TaxID=3483 RepID=A0A7J6DUM5_CANSA|nr:hypothetical protein G4B88_004448 [Cannabis sativa]KAF4392107.1 hypothetical protein F8388_004436 [Cannabis sativa]